MRGDGCGVGEVTKRATSVKHFHAVEREVIFLANSCTQTPPTYERIPKPNYTFIPSHPIDGFYVCWLCQPNRTEMNGVESNRGGRNRKPWEPVASP